MREAKAGGPGFERQQADVTRADVLVVGAGPAGVAAAVTAAESGAGVVLLDERPQAGGQIWQVDRASVPTAARPWLQRLQAAGVVVHGHASVIDRVGDTRLETTRGVFEGHRIILACGARERFLPFPGWTLPGVTGAGGLLALVHDGLEVAGQRIVVAGTGPLLLQVAAVLQRRGAHVLRVAEQAAWPALLRFGMRMGVRRWRQGWELRHPQWRPAQWPVAASGEAQLQGVVLQTGRGRETLACDRLAVGYSLVPNLEVAHLFGCESTAAGVVVDAQQITSVPHVLAAGEMCGVKGAPGALAEGICAGAAAVDREPPAAAVRKRHAERHFGQLLEHTFALRSELSSLAHDDTLVCRCEDVRYADLRTHQDWTSAKLQTRCGMGACQGRVCGAATRHLFGWGPEAVRPPLIPVPLAKLMHDRSSG